MPFQGHPRHRAPRRPSPRARSFAGRILLATLAAVAGLSGAAILPGCSPTEPSHEETVERNRALWESRRPASYAFTFRESCFCPFPAHLTLRITVEGNAVTQVQVLAGPAGGQTPPEPELSWGRTMETIFDQLAEMAASDPARFDVTWNRHWGIPRTVFFDWRIGVVDDERWFDLTEFTPLD